MYLFCSCIQLPVFVDLIGNIRSELKEEEEKEDNFWSWCFWRCWKTKGFHSNRQHDCYWCSTWRKTWYSRFRKAYNCVIL